jgi:hypothetical protein
MGLVQRWGILCVMLACLALVGCGDDDDDGDVNVSGNFRGTIQDSVAGPGTINASLSQSGNVVSGTYQTFFANPANNGSGTLAGTVSGSSVTLTATPSVATACPFRVTGSVDDDELTGTYAVFNCTVAVSGTVNLERQ